MLDEATPLPQALAVDQVHGDRQQAFRSRVMRASGVTVSRVSSVDQLTVRLLQALQEVHERQRAQEAAQQTDDVARRPPHDGADEPAADERHRARRVRQFAATQCG